MPRPQSVVSLDPIDRSRKKQDGILSRLLKTRHYGGKGIKKTEEIGHYLFVGKQRSGKTVSAIWFAERLKGRYEKKNKKVILYSNLGFGQKITKDNLHSTITNIIYSPDTYHIIIIDEIQSYFPKDTKNTDLLKQIDQLTGDFSQIAKKQIYILSTAQVYGRLNKNLREQCLYMVDCRPSRVSKKVINDFILGDDIICDDLGRWSGIPKFIWTHGLPKTSFDTHKMITE